MINFNVKRQRTAASLFCFSLFLVITVSCASAPVIGLARIVSAAQTVVTLMDVSEKALYVVSSLVNTSYETLGEDIQSENFRADNRLSNDIIENMEARHLELDTKHRELDESLDRTNVAANDLFSMLETRANQNSRDSLREEQLQDISTKKETFSETIKVAEDFSSKLELSIKDYDNILNVFQVKVGLGEAQKYIETVDSVISQYELLEQDVQVAIHEGRQVIENIAGDVPSPSPSATVPFPSPPVDQAPEVPSPTSVPPSLTTTVPTPTDGNVSDRPRIGVQITSLTPELRQQINQEKSFNFPINVDQGVLIVEVEAGSPAAESGIQRGDVIITINYKTVTIDSEVVGEIQQAQAGTEIPLEVYRGQQKLEVLVLLK
jgi:hypothetical protein